MLFPLILLSCKEKEIIPPVSNAESPGQNALIFEFTSSWCSLCGGYAWPATEKITSKYGSRALIIDCHVDDKDSMTNSWSKNLAGAYQVSGTPTIVLGYQQKNVRLSGTNADIYVNLEKKMEELIHGPDAALNILQGRSQISGQQIMFEAAVKFTKDLPEQYYLGAYLMEDQIKGLQLLPSGSRTDRDFHHVLRKYLGTIYYGQALVQQPKSNQILPVSGKFDIDEKWNAKNLKVVLAVWEFKAGTQPTVVNAQICSVQ